MSINYEGRLVRENDFESENSPKFETKSPTQVLAKSPPCIEVESLEIEEENPPEFKLETLPESDAAMKSLAADIEAESPPAGSPPPPVIESPPLPVETADEKRKKVIYLGYLNLVTHGKKNGRNIIFYP